MGVAYAQDLRDRVLAAYDRGMKTRQIAELFEVSSSWARRVKQRRRETGETAPRPRGGATLIKIDLVRLAGLVKQRPDATIKELHALLGADCVESACAWRCTPNPLFATKKTNKPKRRARPTNGRTARTAPTNDTAVQRLCGRLRAFALLLGANERRRAPQNGPSVVREKRMT